ncbi:MAG: c-type cytochrome [Ginsengibacter sp.]
MKKSLLIILGCIICITTFQAFTLSQKEEFQNLQILPKDISEHDLDSVMHHFTQSLGVRCDFCHVRNEAEKKMNFVTDEKPEKNIARKMMLMSIDINKNYFVDMDMDHDMDHGHDMDKDNMDSMHMKMRNADKDHMKKDHSDSSQMKMNHMGNDMKMKGPMGLNDSKYMLMEVNCYTCHRGYAHPDSKLPPPRQGPPPPPAAPKQ